MGWIISGVVVLTGLVMSAELSGQHAASPLVPGTPEAIQRSVKLVQEVEVTLAIASASDREWRAMGRKMERAAALRGEYDPHVIDHLNRAASLAYAGGDRKRARRILEEVSERAEDDGDVMRSADALTRAAWIAVELKDRPAADHLSRKALHLSRSPLLTPSQKEFIEARFDGAPAFRTVELNGGRLQQEVRHRPR
jgi:tetratricopeptide (TPR) repeat protein